MDKFIKNKKKYIEFIIDRINNEEDTGDDTIIKSMYNINDKLYTYLKNRSQQWLDKFCLMIVSYIDEKSFIEIIELLKSGQHINELFIDYFFDGHHLIKTNNIIKVEKICETKIDKICETKIDKNNNIDKTKILKHYKNLRKNQILGLQNSINNIKNNNFTTGCHNHIMGSGKTILELIHIDAHNTFLNIPKKPVNYLFISSRINILKNIFFNKKKTDEFKKYNFNIENYNLIDLVYGNIDTKIKFSNNNSNISNIIVANIQYLKIIKDNKKYFRELVNNLKLVIFDECHNISAPNTYTFLNEIHKLNIPILGFSATPMRLSKSARSNFKNIFSNDDKINIISMYDLFEGIMDNCILPFKIKQYEFKGIFNENDDTSDTSEKITYHKHDFDHNKLIIKNYALFIF